MTNNYEWSPRRHQNETDDDWRMRLDNETDAEFMRRVMQGTIQVAPIAEKSAVELILPGSDTDLDNNPVYQTFMTRMMAYGDQKQAAVRDGDPEAVFEYTEVRMMMLRHNPPADI